MNIVILFCKTKRDNFEKLLETRIKNCGSLEESYKLGVEKAKNICCEKHGINNAFQLDKVINNTKNRWNDYRKNILMMLLNI